MSDCCGVPLLMFAIYFFAYIDCAVGSISLADIKHRLHYRTKHNKSVQLWLHCRLFLFLVARPRVVLKTTANDETLVEALPFVHFLCYSMQIVATGEFLTLGLVYT